MVITFVALYLLQLLFIFLDVVAFSDCSYYYDSKIKVLLGLIPGVPYLTTMKYFTLFVVGKFGSLK